jgi:hypothetical protein
MVDNKPAEMLAATERPIELAGDSVSTELTVPASTEARLRRAIDATPATQIYLNVEDIEAERNPGVVYAVYVGLSAGTDFAARQHVGNISLFGIEAMNDPDGVHNHPPGLRHTFNITPSVRALADTGPFEASALTVTFNMLLPVPPPGHDEDSESIRARYAEAAAATPVRVGRVSLFVAD